MAINSRRARKPEIPPRWGGMGTSDRRSKYHQGRYVVAILKA
jgi:hypothetical protein